MLYAFTMNNYLFFMFVYGKFGSFQNIIIWFSFNLCIYIFLAAYLLFIKNDSSNRLIDLILYSQYIDFSISYFAAILGSKNYFTRCSNKLLILLNILFILKPRSNSLCLALWSWNNYTISKGKGLNIFLCSYVWIE